MKFDKSRYDLWVRTSFKWIRSEKDLAIPSRIQGLGIVDAFLYDLTKHDIQDKNGMPIIGDNDIPMFDYANTQSYLWVLGVYELFRMIDQRLQADKTLAMPESIEAVNFTKKQFQRLRIPLAKLEPSGKFKKVDYEIPKIGADEKTLGWQINDKEIFYYNGLSDLALSTLRKIKPIK